MLNYIKDPWRMFLGVPFNITSYALLMYIFGKLTGYTPRKFIHILGHLRSYMIVTMSAVYKQISTVYP